MNNFKVKTLCAAIAGIGSLGAMSAAEAVYLNPDGLGQVLIYPYYTVNAKAAGAAPFQSLLSVVNSTGSAKAVKVRFIEGRNSREVLDFNLFLSPFDVWVAGIVPTTDGGAGVFTPDTSCTSPVLPSTAAAPQKFVNFQYSGSNEDGAGTGLDRTREGYVEIIEMGNLVGTTAATVTHAPGGGKPECKGLEDNATNNTNIGLDLRDPNGGLFGGISLINNLAGEDFTADAVALDEFRTTGVYDAPGDIKPDLRDVSPARAVVIDGTTVYQVDAIGKTVDAVSAVMMHRTVMNEFVLDSVTKSTTDWVLTMPTKRYYFNSAGQVEYLFQRNFGSTGSCDTSAFAIYDREEFQRPGGFSPPPPAGESPRICWEATVVSFNAGNALASNNTLNVSTAFQNGWASISFNPGTYPQAYIDAGVIQLAQYHVLPMSGPTTFTGLPVIGFSAQTFNNQVLPGASGPIQSSYGGNFVHKYRRSITVPVVAQ